MISIEGWLIKESTKDLAFSYLFCGVYWKVNSNNLFCGVYYKVNSNNVSIHTHFKEFIYATLFNQIMSIILWIQIMLVSLHTLKNSSMQPYAIKLCL